MDKEGKRVKQRRRERRHILFAIAKSEHLQTNREGRGPGRVIHNNSLGPPGSHTEPTRCNHQMPKDPSLQHYSKNIIKYERQK